MKCLICILLFLATALVAAPSVAARQTDAPPAVTHLVEPGDTWVALAARYGADEATLRALNPHLNSRRQPAIGSEVALPPGATVRTGALVRVNDGGLLQTCLLYTSRCV